MDLKLFMEVDFTLYWTVPTYGLLISSSILGICTLREELGWPHLSIPASWIHWEINLENSIHTISVVILG